MLVIRTWNSILFIIQLEKRLLQCGESPRMFTYFNVMKRNSELLSSTHILGFHMSSHSKNAINNAILILTLTFHIFDYNKYQIELQKEMLYSSNIWANIIMIQAFTYPD